jgi:hypothetical protein
MHTREIAAYGGLVNNMPKYAVAFLIFTMANVGLPGTSGFVGEFLTLIGVFEANTWVAFFAAIGVILSAAYALWLYRKRHVRRAHQGEPEGACSISSAREKLIHLPAGGAGHLLRRLSSCRCSMPPLPRFEALVKASPYRSTPRRPLPRTDRDCDDGRRNFRQASPWQHPN